jgi:chromosomal replication initiator protein DnaA
LHARVDTDSLVREHADAVLERPAKVVKKAKVPQAMERADIEKQIRIWRARGYDVTSVEADLQADAAVLTASVVAMREGVKKAEAVAEILAGLDITGFESRAASLREKLKDPRGHPDIDTEVESLRDAIESLRQIEARRQVEVARERDSQERTRQVLELVMRQQEALRPGATISKREEFARALEEAPPARDAATNLVQSFTFESLVVGESNRFAHGAAVAVAKQPAKAYNPLLVTSGPGLGKTHLLHAIGNYIASHWKEAKVLYMTCEAFGSGLAEAKQEGSLSSYRERIRGVDCFLLDDIQFLSGMPEIHEELYFTFNDLQEAERQIVLASDRPPKAIPNLDERLVSRFESGLVAGLEPPELPMRIAILERRARDAKVTIDPGALRYIANVVEDNVRELGGAFNRVMAFSSMMGRPITEDLAREVLPGATAEARPVPAEKPIPEPKAERERDRSVGSNELTPGRSYLIEEERPAEAFRLFAHFLGGGGSGLVITRTNPKRVQQGHDLPAARILWLTDREGSEEETIAPSLERIVYEIEDFMAKQPRGAVLLDGIEYLVSNSSFDAVLKFVRRLLDAISESRYAFIISLGPATLKDQELKVLERDMDVRRNPPT